MALTDGDVQISSFCKLNWVVFFIHFRDKQEDLFTMILADIATASVDQFNQRIQFSL